MRDFVGSGSVEEQEQRHRESDARARVIGDEAKTFIERMEVRTMEQAFPPE